MKEKTRKIRNKKKLKKKFIQKIIIEKAMKK